MTGPCMASPISSARPPGMPVDTLWDTAPYPLLVVTPDGALRLVNAAAAALFPGAGTGSPLADVAPAWLTRAHGDVDTTDVPVSGHVGERSFEAHATRREGGEVAWWLIDDTDHRIARDALRMERERTAFLAEASNLLLASLNVERCMEVTARLAARFLADAAVVVAPARGHRLPITSCARDGEPVRETLTADPDRVPGLGEALQGFPPVPSRWIDPASAPDWVVPDGLGAVGSIAVVPLPGHGAPAGALILLRCSGQASFSETEEVFARLFAARAGAAMSAARVFAEQASVTETLMRDLLPPTLRHVGGVEFAAGYRASHDNERVGGDFYDLHPAADAGDETLVLLGDVCGKGLEAAVLAGKIRNTLHALLPMARDHHRMLALLNGALLDSRHTRFATLVLASAARRGKDVHLRLTSAGHPAPLVVRADGRVEEVPTRGTLVGALPDIETRGALVTLAPGETCLLYTDGITEAFGGPLGEEMFGEARLKRLLTECAGMPAEAVVEHVRMVAAHWVGDGPHDDMAVVAITAPRSAHLSAVGGHGPGRFTA